jgi:hypothetical protein
MYDIIEEGGGQMPGVPGMVQVQLLLDTLPPLASITAMAGLAGAMRADTAACMVMPSSSSTTTSSSPAHDAGNSNSGVREETAETAAYSMPAVPEAEPALQQQEQKKGTVAGSFRQRLYPTASVGTFLSAVL